MHRIAVTASLHGVTIQFEQAAYDRLEAYPLAERTVGEERRQ